MSQYGDGARCSVCVHQHGDVAVVLERLGIEWKNDDGGDIGSLIGVALAKRGVKTLHDTPLSDLEVVP